MSATGASFITALNSIATDGGNASSLSGLAANINTINGLIFASPSLTTANQSIITTANGVTNYTLTGGSLEALQGLNDINNLVGGLVGTKTTGDTTSYVLSANYVNASMALGAKIHGNAETMIQNINIIANNVRNTSTLSAVVTALTNAYGANGQSSPSTAEITALDKLINPGDTTAVKNAWQAIVGAQITPQGAASQSSALAALQSALGAKDTASTLQDALSLQQAVQTLNSAMGTSGGLSGKTNSALQAITTNFASGTAVSVTNSNYLQTLQTALGSSGAISQFNAALSGLKNLVDTANISVNNTQPIATTDTANNSPTNTNNASATTTYPATKATGMGGGSVVNSSQITQSVNNQAAYNAAVNQKLGTLLSNALTYSAQEQALKGLLANSSTISQITSSGINNALADTVYGTSDATNNAASTINIVQAIGYSEELLNAYVSALTGPVNSDPLAQASGLAYLSQALNAPFSSAGLIAQTVKTAQDLLNQTPPATFYQGFETAGQMQAALSTAGIGGVKNTATIAQMTTAMSNLSGLQAALPGVAAGGSAAASIATNVATLEATYQAVAGVLNETAKFQAAATGANAADKLAFTLAKVITTSGSESTYIQNWGTGTNIQNTSVRVNGQTMTLAQAITNLTAAATTSGSLPWLLSQINSSTITSSSLGTSDSTIGALITEASTLAGYVTGLSSSNGVSNTTAFLSSGAGAVTDFNNSQTQLIAPQVTPTQFDNYLNGAGIAPSTLGFNTGVSVQTMKQTINDIQALQADVANISGGGATASTNLTKLTAGLAALLTTDVAAINTAVTTNWGSDQNINTLLAYLVAHPDKLADDTKMTIYIKNWATVKTTVSPLLTNLIGSTLASGSLSAVVGALSSSYVSANDINATTATGIQNLISKATSLNSTISTLTSSISSNTSKNIGDFVNALSASNIASLNNLLSEAASQTPSESSSFGAGMANPSTVQQTIAALQKQITDIKGEMAAYNNTSAGGVAPGNLPGSPALAIPLATMLTSGNNANQDLGFASAAVNTMNQALAGVWSTLNDASSLTTTNLNNAVSQVSALSSAMDTLYTSNNNSGATFFKTGNLNGTAALSGGQVVGMTADTTNTTNYFTGLSNLYTITNLLGTVVSSTANESGTYTSASYNRAFVRGTPLVNAIGTSVTNLTAGLGAGATVGKLKDEAQLVQVLLDAQSNSTLLSQLNSTTPTIQNAAYTTLANMLNADNLGGTTPYTGGSAGTAKNIWTAWQALVGTDGKSGSLGTLNGLLVSGRVQQMNTATGIVQLINDASSLKTANTYLTTSSNGGSIVSASGGVLNINSGNQAVFSNAVAAAGKLGALLSNLNSTSQTPTDVINLINALNSYNHNLTILSNLTGSNAGTIASDVVSYLQGNVAMKQLLQNATTAKLDELQQLTNRLTYLENLNQQVQTAIQNNPYALVMDKNALVGSQSYQGAAKALFDTSAGGLLNTSTSNTYSTYGDSQYSVSSNLGTLSSQINSDATNITKWNGIISSLGNASSSILSSQALSTTGVIANATSNLQTMNQSLYNLVGFLNNTNTAAQNQSALLGTSSSAGVIGNYGTLDNDLTGSGAVVTGSLFAGTTFTGNTISSVSDLLNRAGGTDTNPTVLQGLEAVGWLNSNLQEGLGLALNGGSTTYSTISGYLGTNTTPTTINGLIKAVGQALGANAAAGTGPLGVNTNGADMDGMQNITGGTGSGGKTVSGETTVKLVANLVTALEQNGLAPFIQAASADALKTVADASSEVTGAPSSASVAGTSFANAAAAVSAVKTALTAVAGSAAADAIITGNAAAQATAAQAVLSSIYNLMASGSDLNLLNAQLNGGKQVDSLSGSSVQSTITTALQNALDFSNYNTTATTVLASNSLVNGNAAALSVAQINAMQNIVNTVNDIFSTSNVDGASSGAGTLSAAQALVQLVNEGTLSVPSSTSGLSVAGLNNASATTNLGSALALALGSNLSGYTSDPKAYQAQLLAAAESVVTQLASGAYGAAGSAINTDMQQALVTQTLTQAFKDLGNYTSATGSIKGDLNSSNSVDSLSNTSIANATSVRNVSQMLNPSNTSGANGVAITQKNGVITSNNVATIQGLINSMANQQAKVTALSDQIQNGNSQVAKTLNQIQTNAISSQNAINNLGSSAATASGAALMQQYQKAQNGELGLIQAQVDLILANSQNSAGSLLSSLASPAVGSDSLVSQLATLQADTTGSLNSAVGSVVDNLKGMYNTLINATTINPVQVNNNLNSLISQLYGLQTQVLQTLADDTTSVGNVNGGNSIRLENGHPVGMVAAVDHVQVAAERAPSPLVLDTTLSPTQVTALKKMLGSVNNSIAQLTALKTRLEQKSPQYAAYLNQAYTASHTSMQPMNSNGNMYGIDVQFGYKQFFGKKKRWGVRYYANFSYQHGTFMNSNAAELDNFVYGAGVDALYNFYESKDGKYTTGLFAGLMLDGSSWAVKGQSYYTYLMNYDNAHGGHAVMNTSYFQIPLNLGFRTNVNRHNGFEIGLRIPLATNYYFKGELDGTKLDIAYKRNVSVFFNYVYNF
ncbi:outer membrane protein [Helicobacter heilmannii]|uniref:outer membrane protein n=2 Tax=Helicobacter heilmannii TaxID=35817 RepID=UPI000CF18639|nr:outer membrane protein [Helicobacter heilmannii]